MLTMSERNVTYALNINHRDVPMCWNCSLLIASSMTSIYFVHLGNNFSQIIAAPHIDVATECARIRDVTLAESQTQNGLYFSSLKHINIAKL